MSINDINKLGGYVQYKHCLVWNEAPQEETELSRYEANCLIKNSSAWMLRNCFCWDTPEKTNFWELICDRFFPLNELPSKTRNQIRRCLRDCEIKLLTNVQLIEEDGYNVYKEAFKRYHDITVSIADIKTWESLILQDNVHEFWGVFERDSGSLIAYAMNTVDKRFVQYNTLKAIPSMMNKHYPYFGLLYEMNHYYLVECKCDYVSDGWRSITNHSGIQPFLEKNFGFRKAYVRMKLHYSMLFGLAVRILYPIRKFKYLPLIVKNVLQFEEINRVSKNSMSKN